MPMPELFGQILLNLWMKTLFMALIHWKMRLLRLSTSLVLMGFALGLDNLFIFFILKQRNFTALF
jgi:hypothetical protein